MIEKLRVKNEWTISEIENKINEIIEFLNNASVDYIVNGMRKSDKRSESFSEYLINKARRKENKTCRNCKYYNSCNISYKMAGDGEMINSCSNWSLDTG